MTKKPSAEQMYIAQQWLYCNDGEDGESSDCKVVAEWLKDMAAKIVQNNIIEDLAKRTGLSKTRISAVMRIAGKNGGDARAKNLTPERRTEIAKKAATERWNKKINITHETT